jgi:hypothetical protein
MAEHQVEVSQAAWARIAGVALAVIIVVGLAGTILQAVDSSGSYLQHILAHEQRYRVGVACEFVMLNGDIVLAVALYGLLKPVDAPLALLGTFWRCANAIMLGVGVVATLTALDILGNTPESTAMGAHQPPELVGQLLRMHDIASPVGLFFWSMGATIHSYLLWRSRYIPQILSVAYLVVALAIFAGCFGIMLFPAIQATIDPWFVLPDLPVEIAVALWLMIKRVKV